MQIALYWRGQWRGWRHIMARSLHMLSARSVETRNEPGRYADGGGLYLVVTKRGTKSWSFIYRWDGRRPELGLGGYPSVSLAEARSHADIARKAINAIPRQDPRVLFQKLKQKTAAPVSLGAFTEQFLDRILADFKNPKHRQQWRSTLQTYARSINDRAIDDISTEDVLGVLTPIWDEKRETARRVQGRWERILNAAKAQGLRTGENPAQWKGHLETILPINRKQRRHHPALSYDELPDFMAALRGRTSVSALCLEFIILTCVRSGEGRNAMWSEIDLDGQIWTIASDRMKMGKAHRIPLAERPLQILTELHALRTSEFVFPGQRPGKGISETSIRQLLLRTSDRAITTHGFRSTFRDWVFEQTDYPRELAEIALAHNVGDETERAYRRGDALEKRRALMGEWSSYSERK